MTPRERVIAVIEHRKPDRMPVGGWVSANMKEPISEKFGSVENFEDHYRFDVAHLFGGPMVHPWVELNELKKSKGDNVEPSDFLELPMTNPDDHDGYSQLASKVRHHKEERGRFVYVQTPGIFEALNSVFGIENHLCHLIEFEDELREVYRRRAKWNSRFAINCLDMGIDMIHVSDDWGAQNSLMFSPDTWRGLIAPYHKVTCDAVKKHRGYLSLHSDGNISSVIEETLALGYDVLHPYQESAGMSLDYFHRHYRGRFAVMGGLDVQTTLGFGKLDALNSAIERLFRLFRDGGLILCTTHFVQAHCSIEELVFAYDTISELNTRNV